MLVLCRLLSDSVSFFFIRAIILYCCPGSSADHTSSSSSLTVFSCTYVISSFALAGHVHVAARMAAPTSSTCDMPLLSVSFSPNMFPSGATIPKKPIVLLSGCVIISNLLTSCRFAQITKVLLPHQVSMNLTSSTSVRINFSAAMFKNSAVWTLKRAFRHSVTKGAFYICFCIW